MTTVATCRLSQLFNNPNIRVTIMKNYLKPEVDIFDVVAERGYGESVGLPGFGVEQDELIY